MDGLPEFEVDGLPVVQLLVLELMLDDGPVTVQTWLHEDELQSALHTDRRAIEFSGKSSPGFQRV